MDAFYEQIDEDRFASTELTIGPWSMESQHAGPPAALLGRAIERCGDNTDFHVARTTFEILRPVPLEPLTVSAQIVRPGRSVELLEGSLSSQGVELVKVRSWRIRKTGPHDLDAVPPRSEPPPPPGSGHQQDQLDHGYFSAMDIVFVKGTFLRKGAGTAWFRMRYPLVSGEKPSALSRVLIAADSGNGISMSVDIAKWWFVNTDLTVALHRHPSGEWVCLDAASTAQQSGIGLAVSQIWDGEGPLGTGMQSLFIGAR